MAERKSASGADSERLLVLVQLATDAAIVVLSMFVASRLHGALQHLVPGLRNIAKLELHAVLVYFVTPLWILLIIAVGLHRVARQRLTTADLVIKLIKLHAAGFAGLAMAQFLTQSTINRSLVALFLAGTFVLMFAQRRIAIAWADYQYRSGISRERVLLVGRPSRRMAELVRSASNERHTPQLLGYLEAPGDGAMLSIPPTDVPALPKIGTIDDLSRILHEQAVDHVIFLPPVSGPDGAREHLTACEDLGVAASFAVDMRQLGQAIPRVTSKYDHAFVTFEVAPKPLDALAIKYGLDPILAALALVAFAPLLLAVSAGILITMGRPIFYSQQRGGLYGRPFRMLKFRTMRMDAEAQRDQLLAMNEMSGPVFKITDDPRVTPLGKLLRRTSIDELPQLFNVLTGTMSLVGPRPLPVQEQAQIRGWQRRRLSIKPGITCLWQIGGRNEVDFADWMLLDLKYIDEWSLWLDLQILIKTIPVVFLRRGAR